MRWSSSDSSAGLIPGAAARHLRQGAVADRAAIRTFAAATTTVRPTNTPTASARLGRLCDGVEALPATRPATSFARAPPFVKIMANGGVASPTDPIHVLQFSREEMARRSSRRPGKPGTYVAAHLYTDEAIAPRRRVRRPVRSSMPT